MKSNRGVTLLTMGIAVIIILIILSTIFFNVTSKMRAQELDNLYNDLTILSDKVNIYYNKYGNLPIKEEYTQISNIPTEILNPNDYGKYYIVDLSAMENLSLNTAVTEENVFVVNEGSHTVYFPSGVNLDGVIYYRLPEEYTEVSSSVDFSYFIDPAEATEKATINLKIEEITNGIKTIIYPDSSAKEFSENTKTVEEQYEVTQNGDYKFEVILNNTEEKVDITITVSNIS